jgi:hypothetical protein
MIDLNLVWKLIQQYYDWRVTDKPKPEKDLAVSPGAIQMYKTPIAIYSPSPTTTLLNSMRDDTPEDKKKYVDYDLHKGVILRNEDDIKKAEEAFEEAEGEYCQLSGETRIQSLRRTHEEFTRRTTEQP